MKVEAKSRSEGEGIKKVELEGWVKIENKSLGMAEAQGSRPPPTLPLSAVQAGRNHLNEYITPPPPPMTGIDERYSQNVKQRSCADVNFSYRR